MNEKGIILVLYCRKVQKMDESIHYDIVIEYRGLVYCVNAQQKKILIWKLCIDVQSMYTWYHVVLCVLGVC